MTNTDYLPNNYYDAFQKSKEVKHFPNKEDCDRCGKLRHTLLRTVKASTGLVMWVCPSCYAKLKK